LQPPRCLRSSAFFDADFRSQPKAFSFRCRQLRPASFDACLHHRRLQSALLSLLTCHRRLGTSRAPASFNADARRHSCHPPPCTSFDAPFIGQPRCLNRSASLDAHDPSALPCSRSRTFFVCTAQRPRPCSSFDAHDHDQLRGAHVHTRVQVTPCGATEHTHCARSYSAFCHRESLALPSPQEPSCSSFRAFQPELRCTELLPYSREHSLARLAALPTQ